MGISWWHKGTRNRTKTSRKRPLASSVRTRLLLEELESRIVPATFYVAEAGSYAITNDVAPPGLSSGDTVTWNATGGDHTPSSVAGLIFGTDAFTTIQDAFNAATDGAGDMILVAEGTFTEFFPNFNKSDLTLLGNNFATPGVSHSVAQTVMNHSQGAFNITADNVVVRGFTFKDTTNSAFLNFSINMGNGASTGTVVQNNIFRNNISAIGLANSGPSRVNISNNLFEENNNPGAASGTAIYSDQFISGVAQGAAADLSGVDITGNTFRGHMGTAITLASGVAASQNDIQIIGNTFNAGLVSPALTGGAVFLINSGSSTVSMNAIDDPGATAISLGGGTSGATIEDNTINDPRHSGVHVFDLAGFPTGSNSAVTVRNVTINTDTSLLLADRAMIQLVDVGGSSTVEDIDINYTGSQMGRNTIGLLIEGDATGTIPFTDISVDYSGGGSTVATGIDVSGGDFTFGSGIEVLGGHTGVIISGLSTTVTGNTLGSLIVHNQTDHFIRLEDFFLNGPLLLNAEGVSFQDGVITTPTLGTNLSDAEVTHAETKLFHFPDDADVGIIFLRDGVIIGDDNLIIIGSDAGETIVVNGGVIDTVTVTINGVSQGTFDLSGGGRLVVFALGGNDVVQIQGSTLDTEVHGGDGHDQLYGSPAEDILFGDDGNDRLVGSGGNDVLVGGRGADTILAGAGDDIMIGGAIIDPAMATFVHLDSVRDDWALSAPTPPPSLTFFASTANTDDPGTTPERDFLNGEGGRDAYIYRKAGFPGVAVADFAFMIEAGLDADLGY